MPGAIADQVGLAFVVESTFGQVPSGPPTLQDLRFTNESLKQETDTVSSAEIRTDRQVPAVIRTAIRGVGDINLEFSYDSYETFLEASLQSAGFSSLVTNTDSTYSMDDGDNSINDSASQFVVDGFLANQFIELSGFTDPANNGFFKIVSVAVGKMVLSHGVVVTEAAGDTVTIDMGAQIVNGTTQTSYFIEKVFTDLSNEFVRYLGMTIDTFSLDIAGESIVTGSFSFLGAKAESNTATGGDGSNTSVPTTEVFNTVDNVIDVFENAVSFVATSLSFSLGNNLRARSVLGTLGAESVGAGKIDVTGTIQAFFATKAEMDKYRNFTTTAITVVLQDDDGNTYIIDFPSVKYTDGEQVVSGENTDIIADLPFTAFRSATEGITIRIAKFDA